MSARVVGRGAEAQVSASHEILPASYLQVPPVTGLMLSTGGPFIPRSSLSRALRTEAHLTSEQDLCRLTALQDSQVPEC